MYVARLCGYNDAGIRIECYDTACYRLGFTKKKKILFINAQESLITAFLLLL